MAIAPTGDIYKTLTFDGESSRTFGVYITGEAVYNAPKREVEMVSIPGRNGAFALDKGRFENIEVSYPAGIFADTEADFAAAVSDFRNFLCSRSGYVRLTDDYNPDEYRLAIYKSGLEVSPEQLRAGEFNIVFDCKPQRFLTSGEEPITVESGDTITNPTRFEAGPLLMVEGYGEISFNGSEAATVENALIGNVVLTGGGSVPIWPDCSALNVGDAIYPTTGSVSVRIRPASGYTIVKAVVGSTITWEVGNGSVSATSASNAAVITADFSELVPAIHRTDSDIGRVAAQLGVTVNIGGENRLEVLDIVMGLNWNILPYQVQQVADFSTVSHNSGTRDLVILTGNGKPTTSSNIGIIYGDSTKSALGDPTYIDLDLGEAYMLESGEPISLNSSVQIPAELPKLASGANEITFDNTVTELKVVPRWWKV